MQCPVCKTEMKERAFARNIALKDRAFDHDKEVLLDSCEQCGGTWLDAGELNRLDECAWSDIETETVFRKAPDEERSMACPRCQGDVEALVPRDYDAIVVDRCTECRGFWLDSNEMMKWLVSRVL